MFCPWLLHTPSTAGHKSALVIYDHSGPRQRVEVLLLSGDYYLTGKLFPLVMNFQHLVQVLFMLVNEADNQWDSYMWPCPPLNFSDQCWKLRPVNFHVYDNSLGLDQKANTLHLIIKLPKVVSQFTISGTEFIEFISGVTNNLVLVIFLIIKYFWSKATSVYGN